MLRLKKREVREVRRITEYLVSGGAFFWSGYLIFFALDKGLGASLLVATLGSYAVGWTVNFLLQRYWVFDNKKLKKHETEVTGRYLIISMINVPINYAILWFLRELGISPYVGQFVSAGFFTGWNYFWYKYWVFADNYTPKRNFAKRKKRK